MTGLFHRLARQVVGPHAAARADRGRLPFAAPPEPRRPRRWPHMPRRPRRQSPGAAAPRRRPADVALPDETAPPLLPAARPSASPEAAGRPRSPTAPQTDAADRAPAAAPEAPPHRLRTTGARAAHVAAAETRGDRAARVPADASAAAAAAARAAGCRVRGPRPTCGARVDARPAQRRSRAPPGRRSRGAARGPRPYRPDRGHLARRAAGRAAPSGRAEAATADVARRSTSPSGAGRA